MTADPVTPLRAAIRPYPLLLGLGALDPAGYSVIVWLRSVHRAPRSHAEQTRGSSGSARCLTVALAWKERCRSFPGGAVERDPGKGSGCPPLH